jgi:hypothetical protein
MGFKLSSIVDAACANVDLKHPKTGELLGAQVSLAGPEHPKRKALEFARQRRARAAFQKAGKIEMTDPADDDVDASDFLASCILGWSGLDNDDGTPMVYSSDAANQLLTKEGHGWLRFQLQTALGERERFIVSSAQN